MRRDRLKDDVAAAAWLVSRVAAACLLWFHVSKTVGDAYYFGQSLRPVGMLQLDGALREYPTPAALMLWLVLHASSLVGVSLATGLMVTILAVDAVMFVMLRRRHDVFATWAWIVGAGVLGSTAMARFDMVPGVLVGLALLLATIRPRTSGAFLALATGLKLWPAVAVLPALRRALHRRALLAGFVVTGVVTVVVSVAAGGVGRLTSPLGYQSDRGLQIESVSATPLMLVRAIWPDRWDVGLSSFKAVEIAGPGSSVALTVSSVLTVVWLVASVAAYLNLRLWEPVEAVDTDDRGAWTTLAVISGFMVVSKVLSPQYLLWLLPVACAAAALSRTRALRTWLALLVVCCVLTEALFPYLYGGVDNDHGTSHTWPATVCLVLRNGLLTWLCFVAYRRALTGVTRLWPGRVRPAAVETGAELATPPSA